MAEEVVTVQGRVLGEAHHTTLASMSRLATLLQYEGAYERGESMGRRALTGQQNALGNDHPDTVASLTSLADMLGKRVRLRLAENSLKLMSVNPKQQADWCEAPPKSSTLSLIKPLTSPAVTLKANATQTWNQEPEENKDSRYIETEWAFPDDEGKFFTAESASVSSKIYQAYGLYLKADLIEAQNLDQLEHPRTSELQKTIKTLDAQRLRQLLEGDFEHMALDDFEWLHELREMNYSFQEIAELLIDEERYSPWIIFSPQERSKSIIATDLHQSNCVHQGGQEHAPSSAALTSDEIGLIHSDLPDSLSVKRAIAESCGLAGIRPISHNRSEWVGRAISEPHNDSVVSMTYETNDQGLLSTSKELFFRIDEALESLLDTLAWLQDTKLCCNSFIVLSFSSALQSVKVASISFLLITELKISISDLMSNGTTDDRLCRILDAAQSIMHHIYCFPMLSWDYPERKVPEALVIDKCALAVQSLCIGLLSYSNAHVGKLEPFFFQRALERVDFLGIKRTITTEPFYSAELVNLTCIGQMVGNPVLVFTSFENPLKNRKYDIFSSLEDLINIWGPGRFIVDPSRLGNLHIIGVEIGGGSIRPSEDGTSRLHWEKQPFTHRDSLVRLDATSQLCIGGVQQNCSCPLDPIQSLPYCSHRLENLGTSQDSWKATEKQIGIQAGQYAMVQFNATWLKLDGVTLKDRQLSATPDTIHLPFLESLWGLQISFCTGVARRVPVREMLADVMVVYVEQRFPIPPLWNQLLHVHKILDHFRSADLGKWLSALPVEAQVLVAQVVRYTLDALRDTGFDQKREEFVIACTLAQDPFRCFRVHCRDQHLWTRALADSEDCATFAYITSKCLETHDIKCRGISAAQWHNRAVLLDTAVCRHISNRDTENENSENRCIGWTLDIGTSYWIGKPGTDLAAKVFVSFPEKETRLSITRSRIPESFRKRMAGKVHRIRENHDLETNSTRVTILTVK